VTIQIPTEPPKNLIGVSTIETNFFADKKIIKKGGA